MKVNSEKNDFENKHKIFYIYNVKAALKVWLKPYFEMFEINNLLNSKHQWTSFWQVSKDNSNIFLRFNFDTTKNNYLPWLEAKDNKGYAVCRISQFHTISKTIKQEINVVKHLENPVEIYSLHIFLFNDLKKQDKEKIIKAIEKAHIDKFKKKIKEIRVDYELVPKFNFDQKYADKKLKAI